jgi:hypothetical protein
MKFAQIIDLVAYDCLLKVIATRSVSCSSNLPNENVSRTEPWEFEGETQ